MSQPDLKLILDNTLFDYSEVKTLYNEAQKLNIEDNIPLNDGTIKDFINQKVNHQFNDSVLDRFATLYEVSAGKAKLRRYKNKPYADIIYNRKPKDKAPLKADIYRYKLSGGSLPVYQALCNEPDKVISEIAAGGGILEDELVNGIESFFEQYDSKSSLMKSRIADVNKWKNISNYDEFLQVPLLKEGKDFMSKFLDIEDTIKAGGDVSLESLETLMPDYMVDGGKTLTLLDAVDPKYSPSAYIVGDNITDYTRSLIDRSFLHCFSVVRNTTLSDLKTILGRINLVVKQIKRQSNRLVNNNNPVNVD